MCFFKLLSYKIDRLNKDIKKYVFPVKCVDSECQANAVCRHNKCTCKIGFVEIDGSCESERYIFLYLLVRSLFKQEKQNRDNL